jgi:hypothetical protein
MAVRVLASLLPVRQKFSLLGLVVALLAPLPAGAQDAGEDAMPPSSGESARAGTFLPFTATAQKNSQRGIATVTGTHNTASSQSTFEAAAEATLFKRLALRGGALYSLDSSHVYAVAGLTFQALNQEQHGINVAVGAQYRGQGFNLVPAVLSTVALSRRFEHASLFLNLGYSAGLRDGEKSGDVRFAALFPVLPQLQVGFDSRVRVDLEREWPEPPGESAFDFVAGPAASYTLGRFVLSAYGGGSGVSFRVPGESLRTGVVAGVGIGSVFL